MQHAVIRLCQVAGREDRWIVEREQEAHDRQGADWNHEVFPAINELRDLLRKCGSRTVIPIREVGETA